MEQDTPSPSHINLAIRCELLARRDSVSKAIESLAERAAEEEKAGDFQGSVWLLMKCAELLCLDCEHDRAWKLFEERVAALLDRIEEDQQTVVKRNFSFVGIVLGRDTSFLEYYEAVDQAPKDDQSSRGLLAAEDSSRKRQHFDSLPPLWRELNRAFLTGDWGLRRKAHSRLGWEALAAGWIGQTAYHSINGGNEDALKQLAEWLIKWRNPRLLDSALRYALSSNLCEHVALAAQLIGRLSDVIPESHMSPVLKYLLGAIARGDVTRLKERPIIRCLEALRDMSFRLSPSEASLVTSVVLGHPIAHAAGFGRKAVAAVVRLCVSRIRERDWSALAGQVLPWALAEQWDGDYEEVLDLLEAIACVDQSAKERIADAIAPVGGGISDARLQARLSSFGRHTTPDQLKDLIKRVSDRLPGQIWVGRGQAPPFGLSMMMTTEQSAPDGTRARVVIMGGMMQLDVIAANLDTLEASMLKPLIDPICQLIGNPLNVIVNRLELCHFLSTIRTALDVDMAHKVFDTVLPLALGNTDRSPLDRHEESSVSRIQIQGPTVGQQRGFAVHFLAVLKAAHPDLDVDLDHVISSAILDPDAAVRAGACRALGELPMTARNKSYSLVAALQDTDSEVSISAYDAVTRLLANDILVDLHPIIVAVASRGTVAAAPSLRYKAARLIKELYKLERSQSRDVLLDSIVQQLREDQQYSIRSIFDDVDRGPAVPTAGEPD